MFSKADRRYVLRMAVFMALYIAVLWTVARAAHQGALPHGVWLYLAALAPALPIMGAIWAVLRYVSEEEDEFKRFLRVRAFVWATGIALAIVTVWESLAQFAQVIPMQPLYPFSIFVACLGVVQSISACRNR